jgi:hypothetical protein
MTYDEFEEFTRKVPGDIQAYLEKYGRDFLEILKRDYAAQGVTLNWPIKDLDTGNLGLEVSSLDAASGVKYALPFFLS